MTGVLSNSERIRQLYDSNFVRRVELLNDGAPVQVCLDSRMLCDVAGTGVATYARVLAGCLAGAGAVSVVLDDGRGQGGPQRSRVARWIAAAQTSTRAAVAHRQLEEAPVQWVARDIFREAQIFFNLHGRLLPVAFDRPPEVMHWTYPVPLHVVGARNLYTIHDLIPLTDPDLTPIPQPRHAAILQRIVRKAHRLVTVSETVRDLVIDRLNVPADRVTNTLQAIEMPLQSDPPLPQVLQSGRYFFFCGRVERRKNLGRIARAHALSGARLPLAIVGPSVAGEERLEADLRTFPGVIRLPWMPRANLIGMMRRARALLFPSLAEGFGLPVAEAMTLGCPVLTSNRGATVEVAGDAALLVDPLDLDAMARAITRLCHDDALCARLRASGFERGRLFAIDLYERRLRALYADALAKEPTIDGDLR